MVMEGVYGSPSWLRWGILFVALFAVVGCASESNNPETTEFSEMVATALEEARAGGASEDQLEILERARDRGHVTYEQTRAAVAATLECTSAQGVVGTFNEINQANGINLPAYEVDASPPNAAQVLEGCETLESFWVWYLYQVQPVAIEANDDYIESRRSDILACFDRAGDPLGAEATVDEIKQHNTQVARNTNSRFECLLEVGVTGY